MALLQVLVAPDPRLKMKAKPVDTVDAEVKKLMDDMMETMYHDEGIGLAATQVGVDKRVIVINIGWTKDDKGIEYRMANPEILDSSNETAMFPEGCLSVPGQYGEVERPVGVTVKYLDENGKEKTLEADGLLADCIQHEIDHLNGKLFIDHLSSLKRNLILGRLKKYKKKNGL